MKTQFLTDGGSRGYSVDRSSGGTDVMVLGWNCTEKDDTHSLKQDRKRQTEK